MIIVLICLCLLIVGNFVFTFFVLKELDFTKKVLAQFTCDIDKRIIDQGKKFYKELYNHKLSIKQHVQHKIGSYQQYNKQIKKLTKKEVTK